MKSSDPSNFFQFILELPEQIKRARHIFEHTDLNQMPENFSNILFLGMGGSAISGDLIDGFLHSELKIPVMVNRDYSLPTFAGENSLVFASSYSGNTEETISATEQAIKQNCNIIIITSGGKMEQIAAENNIPLIKIPGGNPPRQALGYLFIPLLLALEKLKLIKLKVKEVQETIKVLEDLRKRNHPKSTGGNNLCNHIAERLFQKVPVIYSAAEMVNPVSLRWKCQFNENSKVLALCNTFPELNHNEIIGWEADGSLLNCFNVLFLRDTEEPPRNRKRLEITKKILKKNGISIFEVFSEGESRLARMFSLIYIGDWVSYYLALHYEKDPLKIESIDYLKDALKKH